MKSLLRFEFRRCFSGRKLRFSLCFGLLLAVCHIVLDVLPLVQWLSSWQGDYFLTPHSAYGHWIGMDAATIWPTLFYMLLPLLTALPFSDTAFWDFDSGYCVQIVSRASKRNYLLAKAITIFSTGAVLTGGILLFDFLGTTTLLPLVTPEATTNLYGISNRSIFPALFYGAPLRYTLLYIALDAVLAGAWNCLALVSSVLLHDRLQALLAPFLVYLLLYFVLNWLGLDRYALFAILLPFQPAFDVSAVTFMGYGLAVPLLSAAFCFVRRQASDVL